MKSNRSVIHHLLRNAALLLAGSLLLGAAAFADPPGRVGRIADFTGTIWFFDAEQGEWTQAARNRPLTSGDRLSSDRGAHAELQIGSTMLRMGGGSELELQQVDDERLRVQLNSGSLALRVRAEDVLREVEVTTTEGHFIPLRTGHYRIDRRDNSSFAGAWSGELRFETSDSTLVVAAGQRAEFWQEGQRTHYTWSALENDAFSHWAAAEDRRDDRREAHRYVSPEMTGAEDLDRYGRWEPHAEYGTLWIPHRVAPGWAPYRVGHWAWVRPWGWTWVDDAPWGFAPFHYGRWVSWRGHWAWAPGSYIARPVYAPALVAWIGGGHVSVGISVGSPGYVGWVPLGWREPWVPHYQASPRYVRNVNITHVHVHHDNRGRRLPQEPIMYTNRGVPGGVTVVPSNVLRERQPVAVSQAVVNVDPNIKRRIAEERIHHQAPPAPLVRTVVAPSTVVPPPPGRIERIDPGRAVRPVSPREPTMRAAVPAPEVVRQPAPQAVVPVAPRAVPQPAPAPTQRFGGRPGDEWQPRRGVEPTPHQAQPAPVVRPVPTAPAPQAAPPQAAPAPRMAPNPVAPQAVAPHPPVQTVQPQRRGRDESEGEGRGHRRDRGDEPPGHLRRGPPQHTM